MTFTVSNTDATGVTEIELLSDARILGEKENLAPGLAAVTFTTTLSGGTYQVYCPGADPVSDQQEIFGRSKLEGAPLSGKAEHDTPDFAVKGASGRASIEPTAHIALAAHENNNGTKIRRRGDNYTDGLSSVGQLDAGLLFIAFMKDPAQFVTLQNKLGRADRLNEYIAHIGSAVFAVPPAPKTGHYLAEGLFT